MDIILEEIIARSKQRRERLEAKQPGCTARIAVPSGPKASLDDIFGEEKALLALESAFTAKDAVEARGASVAASYTPKPLAQQLRDGEVTAAQISLAGHIQDLEKQLAAAKPNSTTAKVLSANIAEARSKWARLEAPAGK